MLECSQGEMSYLNGSQVQIKCTNMHCWKQCTVTALCLLVYWQHSHLFLLYTTIHLCSK